MPEVLRRPLRRLRDDYREPTAPLRELPSALLIGASGAAPEEDRLRHEPEYYSYNHHRYSYLLRGRYVDQLRRWLEYFSRSQLLVVQSERLFREPAVV